MNTLSTSNDWDMLLRFLPDGWEQEAFNKRALLRKREIQSPEVLLRVLLMHLAEGISLRSTAAWANQTGLCKLNDSALLGRLRSSAEWLRWLAQRVREQLDPTAELGCYPSGFRIRLVDASVVNEPGNTGSDWRLHYSFNLKNLLCDSFEITDCKVGESLKRFCVSENDLLIGDRVYCNCPGIMHVLNSGGHVLLRYHSTLLPLKTYKSSRFDLLAKLKKLNFEEIGDFDVYIRDEKNILRKGRICAIKKSKEAAEKEINRIKKAATKKQRQVKPETLEFAKYIVVFTTMNRHRLKKDEVLRLYRLRWQIELAFKRLKSILNFGHLPKKDPIGCKAWLHGKMLVALLIERIHREAEFFFPLGIPIVRQLINVR